MKNTAALNQGIKFKTYQKKITKKNVLLEGFSSNQNDILIKQTDAELNHSDELKLLQEQYNNALEKYNESNKKLLDESTNYTKNINNLNTNVFVNHLVNNPIAKYINSFKDDPTNQSMTLSSNTYIDLNKCKMNASNGGYSYFGLQDMQPDGTSKCFLGNDYNVISKYGEYIPSCSKGTDGYIYGGPNVNAIYSSSNMEYIGCYSDKGTTKLMIPSGPDASKSSSVYVSGDFGISPWGSSNFPDKTAKWIWYTQNSQIDAPNNSGVPITLFYMYNYTGNSYINAFLYGMCDDKSRIYLNSTKIGNITGGWGGNGSKLPITISPGMNYIEASVENSGGPAGFLLTALDSENNVLFNTNSNWKYTTILPSNMKVNAQNFSVESCSKYAKDNNYQYFGLQNGSTGTSQCFVSNNLNQATQNGSIEGTASLNGNVYGLKNVNSVYEITPKGDNSVVGKFGYVDEKTVLSEYPLSMIDFKKDGTYQNIQNYDSLGNDLGVINNTTQPNCKSACDSNVNCYGYTFDSRNNVNNCYPKNANIYPKSEKKYTPGVNLYYSNPIINNNDSCEKSIQNIDSIQWDNYKKSGKMMTPETLCGLAKMNEPLRNDTNILRDQLGTIANKIVEKLIYLESLNVNMIQQMGLDKTELDNLLKKYTAISVKYNHYQGEQRNINGIVEDSNIVVLQENYQYIFWSILTIAVVVITIRILNK